MQVLAKIKNQSKVNNLGLKIFNGVKSKMEKIRILSSIFGSEVVQLNKKTVEMMIFTKDKEGAPIINLEADIVALRKLGVRKKLS